MLAEGNILKALPVLTTFSIESLYTIRLYAMESTWSSWKMYMTSWKRINIRRYIYFYSFFNGNIQIYFQCIALGSRSGCPALSVVAPFQINNVLSLQLPCEIDKEDFLNEIRDLIITERKLFIYLQIIYIFLFRSIL